MTEDFDSQPLVKDQKVDPDNQSREESLVSVSNESVEKVIPSDFNRKMKIRSTTPQSKPFLTQFYKHINLFI